MNFLNLVQTQNKTRKVSWMSIFMKFMFSSRNLKYTLVPGIVYNHVTFFVLDFSLGVGHLKNINISGQKIGMNFVFLR
jgi:hypothetical protein